MGLIEANPEKAPVFDDQFQEQLRVLFAWRRDVRRFRIDPVPSSLVKELLDIAQLAPSVGNSQPWRWVSVESPSARARVQDNFKQCNAAALDTYTGERAHLYARLKLEGLETAPVQFAVFSDHGTVQGHRLGRETMPETIDHSVVASILTFWLGARAAGLGVGWVSILEPKALRASLDLPSAWRLVAYLCVGLPIEEHLDPELSRNSWQARTAASRDVLRR